MYVYFSVGECFVMYYGVGSVCLFFSVLVGGLVWFACTKRLLDDLGLRSLRVRVVIGVCKYAVGRCYPCPLQVLSRLQEEERT